MTQVGIECCRKLCSAARTDAFRSITNKIIVIFDIYGYVLNVDPVGLKQKKKTINYSTHRFINLNDL